MWSKKKSNKIHFKIFLIWRTPDSVERTLTPVWEYLLYVLDTLKVFCYSQYWSSHHNSEVRLVIFQDCEDVQYFVLGCLWVVHVPNPVLQGKAKKPCSTTKNSLQLYYSKLQSLGMKAPPTMKMSLQAHRTPFSLPVRCCPYHNFYNHLNTLLHVQCSSPQHNGVCTGASLCFPCSLGSYSCDGQYRNWYEWPIPKKKEME